MRALENVNFQRQSVHNFIEKYIHFVIMCLKNTDLLTVQTLKDIFLLFESHVYILHRKNIKHTW